MKNYTRGNYATRPNQNLSLRRIEDPDNEKLVEQINRISLSTVFRHIPEEYLSKPIADWPSSIENKEEDCREALRISLARHNFQEKKFENLILDKLINNAYETIRSLPEWKDHQNYLFLKFIRKYSLNEYLRTEIKHSIINHENIKKISESLFNYIPLTDEPLLTFHGLMDRIKDLKQFHDSIIEKAKNPNNDLRRTLFLTKFYKNF